MEMAMTSETEFVWQIMHERLNKVSEDMDRLLGNQAEQQIQLDKIDDHIHDIRKAQDSLKAELDRRFNHLETQMKSAVPDGDLEGHRAYHALMMRRWNWVANAKSTVVVKILEVVAIAGLLWVAASIWGGFKVAVGN